MIKITVKKNAELGGLYQVWVTGSSPTFPETSDWRFGNVFEADAFVRGLQNMAELLGQPFETERL